MEVIFVLFFKGWPQLELYLIERTEHTIYFYKFLPPPGLDQVPSKLMRIKLSNRECPFLRLLLIPRIPTNIVIIRYMIFENHNARCITLSLQTSIIFVNECKTTLL